MVFTPTRVKLDMTGREDGEAVDVADVEAELDRIGHELKELDIVLVHTGRDEFYDQLDYIARGPGRHRRGHPLALRARGAGDGHRRLGLGPRRCTSRPQEAVEKDEPGIFWEAHQCDLQYSQIERLVNLAALPPTGFRVSCFPLPIVGASGAPARVVAHV